MLSGGNHARPSFAVRVLRGRWFGLFAAILVSMASGGGPYIFGAYSKTIKTKFGFDQKTLEGLSFCKNLGASLGVLPGLINEVAPPWVLLLSGAGMNLTGYLMIYLAVLRARSTVWLLSLYISIATNAQSFASTAAMVTTVNNFPNDRGLVLGLLMGFAGLSGAILMEIHRAFDGAEDGAALIRLMAWLPSAILLLSAFAVRRHNTSGTATGTERKGVFLPLLCVSVFVGIYLLVLDIVELKVAGRLPRPAHYVTVILLLGILLVSPFIVVIKQELETYRATTTTSPTSAPREEAVTMVTTTNKDQSILQAVISMDMALLFVTTMCGIGGTLTAIDNMAQIGQSLGYSQRAVSMLVTLVSLSNYAGRVFAGVASDYLVYSNKLPRPLALTATLLVACVGHLLIALGVRDGLYPAAMIAGFCLGAQWTVLFAIISEVFRLKHFPILYNLTTLASPVGSYVLNVLVTGRLYDHEAGRHDHDLPCNGVPCFRVSFLIIAGATLAGAAVSLVLVWRTWAFYRDPFSAAAAVVSVDTSSQEDAVV